MGHAYHFSVVPAPEPPTVDALHRERLRLTAVQIYSFHEQEGSARRYAHGGAHPDALLILQAEMPAPAQGLRQPQHKEQEGDDIHDSAGAAVSVWRDGGCRRRQFFSLGVPGDERRVATVRTRAEHRAVPGDPPRPPTPPHALLLARLRGGPAGWRLLQLASRRPQRHPTERLSLRSTQIPPRPVGVCGNK